MSDHGADEHGEGGALESVFSFIGEHIGTIVLVALGILVFFFDRELFWQLVAFYFLLKVAWKIWMHYVQQDFISGIEYVLLEIIPPREVPRSPKAMELFFTNALYHWSNKGGLELYWQGAVWFWYSLEIVSIEGQVHFYIRTPSRLKDLIETQMYAQYPQAQVKVVEDYTLAVDSISEESGWQGWGCEFILKKHHAYPIKTYVDFGLDKDPKEEYKIDPLSPIIELFGSLGKGEQYWLQFVVRPSKNTFSDDPHGHGEGDLDWVQASEMELNRALKRYADPSDTDPKRPAGFVGADPRVKGIVAKMSKLGFDTGIRAFYVARKENYSMNHRRDIRLIFRQFANPDVNELERINGTQADAASGKSLFSTFFLLSNEKVELLINRMLLEYQERAFFHHPLRQQYMHNLPWPISPYLFMNYFHSHTCVLNVEELATLWHFPGQIIKVPTLERIESKEAAPPTNLPM